MYGLLHPHLGTKLKLPVLLYAAALAVMGWRAFSRCAVFRHRLQRERERGEGRHLRGCRATWHLAVPAEWRLKDGPSPLGHVAGRLQRLASAGAGRASRAGSASSSRCRPTLSLSTGRIARTQPVWWGCWAFLSAVLCLAVRQDATLALLKFHPECGRADAAGAGGAFSEHVPALSVGVMATYYLAQAGLTLSVAESVTLPPNPVDGG